jgi:hypothetical protein
MTVDQVIALAKAGELKSMAVKEDIDAMMGYLNMGLIELYKRFPIATEEVILTLGSDGTVDYPYNMISDTIYEMPSDFMYLIAAYDEVPETSGELVAEIPINEESNPLSVNMISWNRVQIPLTVTGAHLSLIYASSPSFMTAADLGAALPIPVQLVEPLLLYMAYKGHSSIMSTPQNEDAVYLARFETSCERVKQLGIFTGDDVSMARRIATRGFA